MKHLLREELVTAGFLGLNRESRDKFSKKWYDLAVEDIKYFCDDGTAHGGFGESRHDQSVLSAIVRVYNLTVFPIDNDKERPIVLTNEQNLHLLQSPHVIPSKKIHAQFSRGSIHKKQKHIKYR